LPPTSRLFCAATVLQASPPQSARIGVDRGAAKGDTNAMSPMTLILPAIAYLVLSAALGLSLGPTLGLAAFGAAAGVHGLWLAARATEAAEAGKRALAQIRRELGSAREEARGILEAIESAAQTRPDLGHVMTEVRVLQGLVEKLSGQPLPKPGVAPVPAPSFADAQVLDIVRDALRENRVELYVQPIVDLPQRRRRHFECFSRMRAPDGTLIGPDRYLPLAESAGLVSAIDNMLLFRCVQLVRRMQGTNTDAGVFVNISEHTLADTRFFSEFVNFMAQNAELAHNLVFELAESHTRRLTETQWAELDRLGSIGFRFSMDQVTDIDVETYTLAKRNFRFVKIEARKLLDFANSARGAAFARIRAAMMDAKLALIVEKIEAEPLLVEILDLDVDYGQGFLFGEPRPLKEAK
jgi:cyclic-di-GMP phosphodiesterase TipF (flagellum assembly factor)